MPFTKRSIEPVQIRQGALDKVHVSLGEEHEVVVNKSYSLILLQLSQLSVFANDIFADLCQESRLVIDRAQRLKVRVWELDQQTKELNVLETPLPESPLEAVAAEAREAKQSQHNQDSGLFTAGSRPDSLQQLYEHADITPRAVFASLGPPGWKAAKDFCLTPVFKEPGPVAVVPTVQQKGEYRIVYERNAKLRKPRPRSIVPRPRSCASILEGNQRLPRKSLLPTPEETVLRSAKSQPSVLVPIMAASAAFDRLALSRSSLRNVQGNQSDCGHFTRLDPRRQTISSPADLLRNRIPYDQVNPTTSVLTSTLLKPDRRVSRPKNPDSYIQDTSDLYQRESRVKEKKPSVLMKLVRRSRSLPRNLGRTKSKEMIVAPDFYEIHPTKSVTISQQGTLIDDGVTRVYTNFYGAPNTELPSPETTRPLVKSKSDHQIHSRLRTKSQSALEEMKVKTQQCKRRPRSVSEERKLSVINSDDKKFHSLSRTFSGLFGRGKKSKAPATSAQTKARSRDSINTVFTTNSDGGESGRRNVKRLSAQTSLSTQLVLRKRDSKATTSSSGRWSGSERFSVDSDGLFRMASQNRLSRVSGDQDSALGFDIGDMRGSPDQGGERTEVQSIYSVDQEGFYTTMHSDSQFCPEEDNNKESLTGSSLVASSTCTSTKTLHEIDKTTPDIHCDSIGSYDDSQKAEEISERVHRKVRASQDINRYSLVPVDGDTDSVSLDSQSLHTNSRSHDVSSSLTKSQTYESELDLVLEELSEVETIAHSDSESIISFRQSPDNHLPAQGGNRVDDACKKKNNNTSPPSSLKLEVRSSVTSSTKSYGSLPRSVKSRISEKDISPAIDSMGSWPRKASKLKLESSDVSKTEPEPLKTHSQPNYKRRSLSPGKTKTSETNEKVRSLIEEARRMSSVADHDAKSALTPLAESISQPCSSTSELVSPYACSNVTTHSFNRKPSYRMACTDTVTTADCLNSSLPDTGKTRRHHSHPKVYGISDSNSFNKAATSSNNSQKDIDTVAMTSLTRAPSYRMAQSQSFNRELRAPSYRRALSSLPHERDSGLGSQEMTSSSDSNGSERNSRLSSYRRSTEPHLPDRLPSLGHTAIRECMKGIYESGESHLAVPSIVLTQPEIIKINKPTDKAHPYSVPRLPPQPTSFNPSYSRRAHHAVHSKCDSRRDNRHDNKTQLQPSKSAPCHNESTLTNREKYQSSDKKTRPMSSYIPNGSEERESIVPDNQLMLPKFNQSAFTSMEMLKREEMAVISILGKIRQTTRPLSFVQTDI